MQKTIVGITGTFGKMEQAIARLAKQSDSFELVENLKDSEVIIDFSTPENTQKIIEDAINWKVPLVIGTTGLSNKQIEQITEFSTKHPVVYASNMSMGIAVLRFLVKNAASFLDNEFEIEVCEAHHSKKVDAPSGTAITLAKDAANSRGWNYDDVKRLSRDGNVGTRFSNEIGMQVIRAGNIVGEHTVMLCGTDERIELTHKAWNRDIFARGALKAAEFVNSKRQKNQLGLYSMNQVLGIPDDIK